VLPNSGLLHSILCLTCWSVARLVIFGGGGWGLCGQTYKLNRSGGGVVKSQEHHKPLTNLNETGDQEKRKRKDLVHQEKLGQTPQHVVVWGVEGACPDWEGQKKRRPKKQA